MLKAEQINTILNALHQALREKIPRIREPSVESVEGIKANGTNGSVIFGIILLGETQSKLTIVLDWETALKLSAKLLSVPRLEEFSDDAQLVLEDMIKSAGNGIAEKFSATQGSKTEAFILPTLVEGNALLSLYPQAETIKITIKTLWEPISLFIACPRVEEAANAA